MIHLNKNYSGPAQKKDLENSLLQSASLPKFLKFRCISLTSEGRGYSRNIALSRIYQI